VPSILNPAPGQPLDLAEVSNADYVVPNETEAEALSGMPVGSIEEARTCARSLRERGLRGVIVTLGANGALFGDEHIAPHPVNAVDTTGAGDAFIGAFATFLAGGDREAEAIRKANVYAALSTVAIGTQSSFVTLERFEKVWRSL
jgi:ribokinase